MRNALLVAATSLFLAWGCQKESTTQHIEPKREVPACGWDDNLQPKFKQEREMIINARKGQLTPVILLDTNGYYAAQSSWASGGSLNVAGAGLDSTELQEVYDSVVHYYRYWDVIVTFDEAIYQASNPYKRGRVVLTTDWAWFGLSGGVAYINSFTWGDDTPSFVFTELLGYRAKSIGVAAAHEAGHMLGLQHQSVCSGSYTTAEYNPGTSFSAPIMGLAYYTSQPCWWVGTNTWCQQQDDVAIISSVLKRKRYIKL